ncbi:HCL565Wp [Eremothecium sinecaudum]|uniref:ubiquitinyl hydrolase 1 n=1 Tax=Eremothecium sinecaudum TaxID=45286 RepID=A0A109UXX9_9SACH|nr:HCL565Wp [Eremothecium sinecaudum]AMD19586.1 HCL565Wp [Eremothecium sinecaudum]
MDESIEELRPTDKERSATHDLTTKQERNDDNEPSEGWKVEITDVQSSLEASCRVEISSGSDISNANAHGEEKGVITDTDSMLVDAIPNLSEQRIIINKLWADFVAQSTEGDKMYIVPSQWSNAFFDQNQTDHTALGEIDVNSVVVDYSNLLLENYESHPYVAVPEPVFLQWQIWYGLTPSSRPLYTVLVENSQGQLMVEYDRPKFRIHYLTAQEDVNSYRYSNRAPLFFTTSRLSTMRDVVTKVTQLFCGRESHLDINNTAFRTWYVKDKSTVTGGNDCLASTYKITTSVFIELPIKHLIKREQYGYSIKNYDSETIDLAIEAKTKGTDQHWASNYYIYSPLAPSKGTIGLSNLGNTCYMNAALQCLVHIPEFRDYFLYDAYEKEINSDNPLGYKGHIALAVANLIHSLFDLRRNVSIYSPRNFKTTISHLNSLFAGYQQQDSQEFLAFLLDGLHEDLNRIKEKPYVEKPELNTEDNIAKFEAIKKLADETWAKHKLRNKSVILDLFVGLYKSTLVCPECEKVSITFDPYNELTLPLPVESTWSGNIILFPHDSSPYKLEVELKKTDTYRDLKKYIANCTGIKMESLLGMEIFNHQFYSNFESTTSSSQYLPIHELISASDVVVFYEVVRSDNDLIVPVMNTIIEDGFRSAKLCGYPFFISLSEKEQCQYGALAHKLEQMFKNWSGGFNNFPLISNDGEVSLDSLPLLRDKYPNVSAEDLENELGYINPNRVPNEYYNIKIYDGKNLQNQDSRYDMAPKNENEINEIWTPAPHVTFNKIHDITENIPEYIKDAYFYKALDSVYQDRKVDICNSNVRLETGQDKYEEENNSGNQAHRVSESDMEIEYLDENHERKPLNHEMNLSLTPNSDPPLQNSQRLVGMQNAIVCEWNSRAYDEVFDNSVETNWDRPSKRINTELEAIKGKRHNEDEKTITLLDCLTLFSTPEVLGASDSWYCPNCKVHRQATKQIELWNSPDILLIQLKRFENQRSFSDKIDDVVNFPINDFDMSPYLICKDDKTSNIYDLIAVDNHYGGLGGGHYTAYVKNFVDNKWYYFDDSRVTETIPERSIAGSAYLLFYRRQTVSDYLGGEKLSVLINDARKKHDEKIKQFNDAALALYEDSKTDDEDEIEAETEKEEPSKDFESNKKGQRENLSNFTDGSIEQREIQPFKGTIASNSDYSIASLEVGEGSKLGDSNECDQNTSRRKLRLLQKTYNTQSINIASPESTSCSSSCSITDSATENVKEDQAVRKNLPDSPLIS